MESPKSSGLLTHANANPELFAVNVTLQLSLNNAVQCQLLMAANDQRNGAISRTFSMIRKTSGSHSVD